MHHGIFQLLRNVWVLIMSEWYAAVKGSMLLGVASGVLISFNFVNMTKRQKIVAFPISLVFAEALGNFLGKWLSIETPFAVGLMFGLFGMNALKLAFDAAQKSSLVFDLQGIVNAIVSLIRR